MSLPSKKIRIVIVIALIALGISLFWLFHRGKETTDDAQIDSTVVTISPKVSGYVQALHITDNALLQKGDAVLEIDPTDYNLKRDRATAALASAKAFLAIARANREKAQNDLARLQALGKLASSRQQLDDATTLDQTTTAALQDAEAKQALAEADLAQTTKDLADTKITAPMAGRVARKGVEQGNYIQPGQQLAYIVSPDIWVTANFKETQLADIKPGQRVDITIDAFPDVELHGKIDSFQSGTGGRFSAFPAENASGNFVKIVQRVPVKIILDKRPDSKLPIGAGLSVVVTVHTN